jgi:ABC-type transporter Mla subunit MlaD
LWFQISQPHFASKREERRLPPDRTDLADEEMLLKRLADCERRLDAKDAQIDDLTRMLAAALNEIDQVKTALGNTLDPYSLSGEKTSNIKSV